MARLGCDIIGPQQPCNNDEKRCFSHMDTRTDSPSEPKVKVVSLMVVWVDCGFCSRQVVTREALRTEFGGFWVEFWVLTQGGQVGENDCALPNLFTLVPIILRCAMWSTCISRLTVKSDTVFGVAYSETGETLHTQASNEAIPMDFFYQASNVG